MASTFEAYPEGSSVSGLQYTTTTLTEPLTTVLTSESVYNGDETTTLHIATVIPAGTVIINELVKGGGSKKVNTTVIVAAAVGGFVGLVLIGVAAYLIRRRKHRRRARMIPPSPSILYAPSIPPVSITPYAGYQPRSSSAAPPYQQRPLTTASGASNAAHYPAPIVSEKSRNRMMMLQNPDSPNHLHPPHTSRPSIDNTGSSVLSQPYTVSSVYSTTTGTGSPLQNAQGTGPQPVHKQRYPQDQYQHQHQRTGSTTSNMSGNPPQSVDPRNIGPFPTPPNNPRPAQASSYHGQVPGRNVMGNSMGPVPEGHPSAQQPDNTTYGQPFMGGRSHSANASVAQGTGQMQSHIQYSQQQPHHLHQSRSYHAHPQGSSGSGTAYEAGSSSSGNVAGGSAIVDRGVGGGEQVYAPKNAAPPRRTDAVEDVDERATNLSELPPTYDSLPNRARGASD